MSNNKMKGLLKGLRYISHIFENEKESEMQIGYPTDVKHVAHIGWDGQSVNTPSWMNDSKAPPGFSSAPLSLGGEGKDDSSIKLATEESSKSARCSPARDLPDMPKASRRHASTGSSAETPMREKSEKTKQSKKSSKGVSKGLSIIKSNDSSKSQEVESPTKRPEIPKKSRRKKSRDSMEGSSRSSRISSRRANGSKSDSISECGSVSRADDLCQTSGLNSSEGGEDKGYIGIS
ncbi:hypothetical protein Patl1_01741 [Pistacia atlantica]|uniref:Uncharacterized protein n=1 Tax=Pistacia atlantica TaxID=434234 RepID=A0ACC1C4F0_9ROSI|nr:hypothetical protein Patl1_01741 [Pistacia atlantica]